MKKYTLSSFLLLVASLITFAITGMHGNDVQNPNYAHGFFGSIILMFISTAFLILSDKFEK